jgi:drug/metabolite transporter (DMT)-like permease
VAQASAVAFTAWAAIDGGLALPPSMAAWGSLVVIAVVSTVVALRALLAGLARIGPGRTAVLSALEVPLTLGLAAAFLGEGLGARQWAGGGLILGAVLLQNIAMPGVLVRRRAGPLGSGGRGGGREGN